jgi:hypothetical protein
MNNLKEVIIVAVDASDDDDYASIVFMSGDTKNYFDISLKKSERRKLCAHQAEQLIRFLQESLDTYRETKKDE